MKLHLSSRAVLLVLALPSALLPLAGCRPTEAKPAESRAALTVTSSPLVRATWPQTLELQGAVAAWQEAQVSARVSGLALSEVAVNVGDRVKRGQLLARFDDRTVRSDVAVAQATLNSATANAAQAAANRDRTLQLKGSGAVSDQDLQLAQTQADTALAQRDLAAAQLAAQRVRLADCEVRAVDDGAISARSATVGQVAPAGAELFRLIRRERLEWRAELNAAQLAQVRIGQPATLAAADGQPVVGHVRQLAPALDGASRLGIAYVDLPAGAALRSGTYAGGRIELAESDAIVVPAEAVVIRDGRSSVFRLVAEGGLYKVAQQPVQTGRRRSDTVELLTGLPEGSRVAVRGAGFLNDGDKVRDLTEGKAEVKP